MRHEDEQVPLVGGRGQQLVEVVAAGRVCDPCREPMSQAVAVVGDGTARLLGGQLGQQLDRASVVGPGLTSRNDAAELPLFE